MRFLSLITGRRRTFFASMTRAASSSSWLSRQKMTPSVITSRAVAVFRSSPAAIFLAYGDRANVMLAHQARECLDRRVGLNPRHTLVHCVLTLAKLNRSERRERIGDSGCYQKGVGFVRSNINVMR